MATSTLFNTQASLRAGFVHPAWRVLRTLVFLLLTPASVGINPPFQSARFVNMKNKFVTSNTSLLALLVVGLLLGSPYVQAQTTGTIPANQIAALTTTVINTTSAITSFNQVAEFTRYQLDVNKATLVDANGGPVTAISLQKIVSTVYNQEIVTRIRLDFTNAPIGIYYVKSTTSSPIAPLDGNPIYYRVSVIDK